MQLGISELRCAVNGDKEIEPSLFSADLGDVHVEIADGVFSELFLRWLVAFDFGQAVDAVALQTTMEAGTSQIRNTGLEGIQAIVERQQRLLTKGYNHDFLFSAKHSRVGLARPHPSVFD